MFQINQAAGNLDRKQDFSKSDSTVDKLHLLFLASEVCYRRVISLDCSALRQIDQRRIRMFEDAIETLSSSGSCNHFHNADVVNQALKVAYDVFSADAERQDVRFYDVSYGVNNADGDFYRPQHH